MPAFQSIPEFDLSAKYHLKAVGCEQQAEHATDPTTEQVWRQSVRSVVGQTEKNSLRANVFRVTPERGHCSMQSACLKGANNRHDAALFDYFVRQT